MQNLSWGNAVQELLLRCISLPDGFLAPSIETRWRLGAVLMAECAGGFAVVRKAPVTNEAYEFAGLMTLPGGMVRLANWPDGETPFDAGKLTRYSLHARAKLEAGLDPSETKESVEAELGPIVTSYLAKGQQRFTLIVVYTCEVKAMASLAPNDHSVDEAIWVSKIDDWTRFAPANRLIVAHLRWSGLDSDEQEQARAAVESAAEECSAWARRIGLPTVPVPWASSTELKAWRSGWGDI